MDGWLSLNLSSEGRGCYVQISIVKLLLFNLNFEAHLDCMVVPYWVFM